MTPFKLQSVLDYRKIQKDKAQQQLAESMKKEASLMAEIARLREEMDALHCDMQADQVRGVTPQELEFYENRCTHNTDCATRLQQELEAARSEVIARRHALTNASQDKKVLEKLKQKKLQEAKKEMEKKENAASDEVALRFHRR